MYQNAPSSFDKNGFYLKPARYLSVRQKDESSSLPDRFQPLRQRVLQHLTDTAFGQVVDWENFPRYLVAGKVLAAPAVDIVQISSGSAQDNEGCYFLAEFARRPGDDGGIAYRFVLAQHVFDLRWINIHAAPDDDVLGPARQVQVTGLIPPAEIAWVIPAVAKRLTAGVPIVVISRRRPRMFVTDTADLSERL